MGAGNLIPRDVRPSALSTMKGNKFQPLLSDYLFRNETLDSVLGRAGEKIVDISKSYFGESPPLYPNSPNWAAQKGGNSPLVHFGYLRDAWSYRTSENLSIRNM